MFRLSIKFLTIFMMGMLVSATFTGCGGSSKNDIKSLTIDSSNDFVIVGDTEKFSANALFDDGTLQDVSSATSWNISDDSIASVDNTGVVTGLSEGTVTLTATYNSTKTEISVQVYPVLPTFVSAGIAGDTYLQVGKSKSLNAYVKFSDGTEHNANGYVNWSSSDTNKATVNANGVVTGVTAGKVKITATGKNNPAASFTHAMIMENPKDAVTPPTEPTDPVIPPTEPTDPTLKSIQIEEGYSPASPTPINYIRIDVDEERYITAWGIYSDGERVYINTKVTWRTADRKIASMNTIKSSNVKGVSAGDTTVTASFGTIKSSPVTVTVYGE